MRKKLTFIISECSEQPAKKIIKIYTQLMTRLERIRNPKELTCWLIFWYSIEDWKNKPYLFCDTRSKNEKHGKMKDNLCGMVNEHELTNSITGHNYWCDHVKAMKHT